MILSLPILSVMLDMMQHCYFYFFQAVGSQRIQVKSESVPSVEVETMVGCRNLHLSLLLYFIDFVCHLFFVFHKEGGTRVVN